MHVSGVSHGSFAAILAGARGELKAGFMRRALGDAGLLNHNLDAGFRAVEATSRGLAQAGVRSARLDLVGTLIDVLG